MSSKKRISPIFMLALMFLANVTLALETTYHFEILQGSVTQTPAEINIFDPVKVDLTGEFKVTFSDNNAQFSDVMLSTNPDIYFMLPELKASFDGLNIKAVAEQITFDKGYQGSFDNMTLTIKGSSDSRPVDGPLIEYEFTAQVVEEVGVGTGNDQYSKGYFVARPDFRECASPMCGGYFVKQVNRQKTLCADGYLRSACYVARIESTSPSTVGVNRLNRNLLLKGHIARVKIGNKGNFGVFKAKKAYVGATEEPVGDINMFVALENNGIVCISSPCFSYDQAKLNSIKTLPLSGVDLTRMKASPKKIDAANNALANGKVLFAAGINKKVEEFAGVGRTFVAKQFYMPMITPVLCAEGYDSVNGECVTPYGCIAPELELTGYGGAPMIDPITGEITSSITKSCVASCVSPAQLVGPARCEIYSP